VALVVARVDASGEWFRHVPHGADPGSRPQPPSDSRWQRGSVIDALYLADDEQTVWAEWYRYLAELGVPPMQQLPRDLWRVRVPALEVADLSDEDRLQHVGLPLPRPGRTAWPRFQSVGEALWREGWPGFIAPSAARPEGRVLCLFVNDPQSVPAEPVPPPDVVAEPPAPPQGMRT
jgi:hypothetical protein